MDFFLYFLLALPVILLSGAAALIKRCSNSALTLAFVVFTLAGMAVDMIVGLRESNKFMATGGWTAATLTPFLHWIGASLIVVGSFILWLCGLGLFALWKRRGRIPLN